MFKRKTVIEVLEKNDIHLSDEIFLKIYKRFHRQKCKSRIKSISYKKICQLQRKDPNNWLHIIQEDAYKDSVHSCWEMNPFKGAVIIVTATHCLLGFFYQKTRIFTYTPSASSDIISVPNFSDLKVTLENNPNLFHVYRYNEECEECKEASLVTQFEKLNGNDEIICVSKFFPYIVMKY